MIIVSVSFVDCLLITFVSDFTGERWKCITTVVEIRHDTRHHI